MNNSNYITMPSNIHCLIDHAILKPDASEIDVIKGCEIARLAKVATVCVRPYDITIAVEQMKSTNVNVSTVIAFPHGDASLKTKLFACQDAISLGAKELDVVISIGKIKSGKLDYIREEISQLRSVTNNLILKIIIATGYLTEQEIVSVSDIVAEKGAQFVKTSTGFDPLGATVSNVKLIRKTVGDSVGIKASGGIRSLNFALELINAGATRIGTSSTESILKEIYNNNS